MHEVIHVIHKKVDFSDVDSRKKKEQLFCSVVIKLITRQKDAKRALTFQMFQKTANEKQL